MPKQPKHDAVDLLRAGFSPSRIAERMNESVEMIVFYLFDQVVKGRIFRSDILLSIPKAIREKAEGELARHPDESATRMSSRFRRSDDPEQIDMGIYLSLRGGTYGDMYEFIREIELTLYRLIQGELIRTHKNAWWRAGIPAEIRAQCAASLELDAEPAAHPYSYTTFLHLHKIFEKRWAILASALPAAFAKKKTEFLSTLGKIGACQRL